MGGNFLITLNPENIAFSAISIVDEVGKVFFYQNRVFRAIYSEERAEFYSDLLSKTWIKEVFDAGLIKTRICEDIRLENVPLILEHEKIPFETHPAEHSSYMHWLAAKRLIDVNLALSRYGYILKDGHPWNVMFQKGNARYIDLGSIIKAEKVSPAWFEEFRKYFCVPIWIASTRWKRFALEYRRQHSVGFGLALSELFFLKKLLFRPLDRMIKHADDPFHFFSELNNWLDRHEPVNDDKDYWADYMQSHGAEDPLFPETAKQIFVYDVLAGEKPGKVLDCAANKGYYAKMAARLGASVAAFDYEEFCVDACLNLAQTDDLDITPVFMDFKLPTPNYGIGLLGGSAFGRFQSDIVLALGIAHHLCITQRLPVKTFCDICLKYAKKGVVLEYVDPTDKHVVSWNISIPKDYSLEKFIEYFLHEFPKIKQSERITEGGLCRNFVYFSR